MKQGRRPVALTIMAVVIGMVFILPAAPALAASCGGSPATCDHKSPEALPRCSDDAVTKKTVYIPNNAGTNIGKVELRWSPSCGTAWGRTTSWIGPVTLVEQIERYPNVYDTRSDPGAIQGYSRMLYVRNYTAGACGTINEAFSACTPYMLMQ